MANFYEMNKVSGSPGARELTITVPTTATGGQDVYYIPPQSDVGVGITFTVLSTCIATVQATTDTIANIVAGTALWVNLPAPFANVTTGSTVQGGIVYSISALRVYVNTALAGNQATIAISTRATRN